MKEPPPDCGPRLVPDEQAAVGLDGLLEVDGQADVPGGSETVIECLFVDGTGLLVWQRALELDVCLPEIVGQGDPCNTGLYIVLQVAFGLDCLPGIDKHGLVPAGRLVMGGVCLLTDATGFELQVAFGVDGLLGVEGHGDAVVIWVFCRTGSFAARTVVLKIAIDATIRDVMSKMKISVLSLSQVELCNLISFPQI